GMACRRIRAPPCRSSPSCTVMGRPRWRVKGPVPEMAMTSASSVMTAMPTRLWIERSYMDSSCYPVSGTLRPERDFLTRVLVGPVSPPAYRMIGLHETSMRGRYAEQESSHPPLMWGLYAES